MKKLILKLCLLTTFLMLLTGCAGQLTEKEYDAMLDYIIENTNIENIEKQASQAAGEGENVIYKFSGTIDGNVRSFTLHQVMKRETFRVYELNDVTDGKWAEILEIRINDDGTLEPYYSLDGYGEKNKAFLMENLELDNNSALRAACQLKRIDSGFIVQCKDIVEENDTFRVTLVNEAGDEYITSFDKNRDVESIMDEEGNYLYKAIK